MPRVLLLNPSPTTAERAKALPSFFIGVAYHDTRPNESRVSNAGDPREWELIVHCMCGITDRNIVVPADIIVNNKWLEEARAPHIILRCQDVIWLKPPDGHLRFEVKGDSTTFDHLSDLLEQTDLFVPGNVHKQIGPGSVTSFDDDEVIAWDAYGHTVAALGATKLGKALVLPQPKDTDAQAAIVDHMLTRSLMKLFPEAYWDTYTPARIVRLMAERDEVLRKRQKELLAIDEEVAREHDYFAPFRLLPLLRDDALKEPVINALQAFGFQDVRDLDADDEKQFLDADLIALCGGRRVYIETRGVGLRNCQVTDLERFDRNIHKAEVRYGNGDVKLLVFNGELNRPPTERSLTFAQPVIDEAVARGIGLTTGADLLQAVERIRAGEIVAADVAHRLSQTGLLTFS